MAVTSGTPVVQRFQARSLRSWQRDGCAHLSPVRIESGASARSWSSRLAAVTTGDIQFASLEASSHRVLWPNPQRWPSASHRMRLIRIGAGQGRVIQDGRTAELRAGDYAIYDDARPYMLELDTEFDSVLLAFPKRRLEVPGAVLERLTAVRIKGDSGIGRLASAYLGEVGAELEEIHAPQWPGAHRAAMELLSSSLLAQFSANRIDEPGLDEFLRACEWVEANLDDPGLTSLGVASAMFMSRRRLQQLFRDHGTTVAEYIRTRRLERARVLLEDPARADATIAQIAYECGIDNPAYFSRIFGELYGRSPREHRAAGRPLASSRAIAVGGPA